MKKIAILGAVAAVVFSSCGTGAGSLKTEQDSLAYAVGLDFGNYVKGVDSTLDVNVIAAGIKAVLANDTTTMTREAAYNFMRDYFMVRKPKKEKEASEKFLQDAEKNNANAKKTASGLIYEIVTPGDEAAKPKAIDTVRVVYEGKLKTGKVFDSSKERNDTVKFAVNQVIPGWTEGIQLVGKGGEINMWIPSELAYGERGAGQAIGPNEALQFNVTHGAILPVQVVGFLVILQGAFRIETQIELVFPAEFIAGFGTRMAFGKVCGVCGNFVSYHSYAYIFFLR